MQEVLACCHVWKSIQGSNPKRDEVEKLWPDIPVLLSAPLRPTSEVLLWERERLSNCKCTEHPIKVSRVSQEKKKNSLLCSNVHWGMKGERIREPTHTRTHKHTCTRLHAALHLLILCKLNQMIFWIAIKQSLFCLARRPSRTPIPNPPPTLPSLSPLPTPSPLQPHRSRISFPPRIPLKRCHVGWRQSAEMLLRYSCSFSKAPNSIYGHIYYHVCQWLKGSFIIRSTHLIWSQQAASLGQYALYYTVRASRSTEEKENMSKQKTR